MAAPAASADAYLPEGPLCGKRGMDRGDGVEGLAGGDGVSVCVY